MERKEKNRIRTSRMSITMRVAVFFLVIVLLPMFVTGISLEYGWLVPGRNLYLAIPLFLLFLLVPISRLLSHYLINKDLLMIGVFCNEVKKRNYEVFFNLPNQKDEEDPFFTLLRDLTWMSHNIEMREAQNRSKYEKIRHDYSELEEKALTDSLTGLFNRHYLEQFTQDSNALETFDQVSVLYIDCDRFKSVNDTYGHDIGDRLLSRLAYCLKGACRLNHDIPVRMGGDEFLVFLPEADITQAEGIAKRIRALYHKANVYNTSLSMGISHVCKSEKLSITFDQLVKEADEQTYCAKQSGGNEISIKNVLRRQCLGCSTTDCNECMLADFDALTGLPNRYLAEEWFGNALERAQFNGQKFCLIFLDLDDFKTINETLGHYKGDQYLKYLAGELKKILRLQDSLFRLGGDEFLVMPSNVQHEEDIAVLATKIIDAVKRPVTIGNTTVSITVSLGIARAPDDGDKFDDLCKRADIALFRAKKQGKNSFCLFTPEMGETVNETIALTVDLRSAVQKNELELYYQPQVDLHNKHIIGVEALIRWNHPKKGLLNPGSFIHLAERSGQIVELGKWIIDRACCQCANWAPILGDVPSVAINISPLQITRSSILGFLQKAMQRYNLPGGKIELEFTETLLLNNTSKIEQELISLREEGITFAIDDFGTGYSNLNYLKFFDISKLKIDKSFVLKMIDNREDQAIVTAIIQMTKSLQIKTIAEGIEDRQTLELLKQFGCDYGQGYFWTKPLPEDKFLDFCQDFYAKNSNNGKVDALINAA